MKKFLLFLVTILGFGAAATSCEENRHVDMYGVPLVEYTIKARVVDTKGNPIPGIKVSKGESQAYPEYFEEIATTDDNGAFEVIRREYVNQVYLHFEDVDGEANGGEFEEQFVPIYANHFENDIVDLGDVTLESKDAPRGEVI